MLATFQHYDFNSFNTATELYSDEKLLNVLRRYTPEEPTIGRQTFYLVRHTAELPPEPSSQRLYRKLFRRLKKRLDPPHTFTVAPISIDLIIELAEQDKAPQLLQELRDNGFAAGTYTQVDSGQCDFRVVQYDAYDELEKAKELLLSQQAPRSILSIVGPWGRGMPITECRTERGTEYTLTGRLAGLLPTVITTAHDIVRAADHSHITIGYSWVFYSKKQDESLNRLDSKR